MLSGKERGKRKHYLCVGYSRAFNKRPASRRYCTFMSLYWAIAGLRMRTIYLRDRTFNFIIASNYELLYCACTLFCWMLLLFVFIKTLFSNYSPWPFFFLPSDAAAAYCVTPRKEANIVNSRGYIRKKWDIVCSI